MMDAKVNWKGRLTFVGQANSGFPIQMGTDPDVGGDNDGVRPMEMIAIGLAGCTAMDVVSILQKKRQEVTDFEVRVHAEQSHEYPKVFTLAVIEYIVTGRNIDEAAFVRAIELSATRYCPAQSMLSKAFPMELRYQLFDAVGGNLLKKGVWQQTGE